MFTITRNTLTGKQEVLTEKGFKTREWILDNNAGESLLVFDKKDGSIKVKSLQANCRIASIKKSIMLNYA